MNPIASVRSRPRRAGRSRPPTNRRARERSASKRRTPARDANRCGATRRRNLRATRRCLPRVELIRSVGASGCATSIRATACRCQLPSAEREWISTRLPSTGPSACTPWISCVVTWVRSSRRQHLFDLDPVHGHGTGRQAERFAAGRQRHLGETGSRHDELGRAPCDPPARGSARSRHLPATHDRGRTAFRRVSPATDGHWPTAGCGRGRHPVPRMQPRRRRDVHEPCLRCRQFPASRRTAAEPWPRWCGR